jgi:hypothetical protein
MRVRNAREQKMASNFDGIQITPSDDTKRKIATLAVLTGQNVSLVLNTLEEMLNETLTQKCIELLGGSVATAGPLIPEDIPLPVPVKTKKPKSFAEAERAIASPPPIETEEEAFTAIGEANTGAPQHELSADEDTQENKSLEEQVEEDEDMDPEELEQLKQAFSGDRFKKVGKNAEAFLDSAMGDPDDDDTDEMPSVTRGYAGTGRFEERPLKATKSFESRIRKGQRARVSPHTGDED